MIKELIILTVEHIYITLMAVGLAMVIAIPFAVLIYKKDFYVNHFVNIISLLQAFPALGLFALLIPFLGIGKLIAIVTLALYALLPIFLGTLKGLQNINPEYRELFLTLDISEKDIFFKVELPNAMPSIISGIRLATIYTIGLATIATLVGSGGLGDLIYLGLQTLDLKITIAGIIPLIFLTIIANHILNKVENYLLPMDLKQRSE